MIKNIVKVLIVTSIFSLFVTHSWALERFDIITTAQLHEMLEKRREGKENFMLINTLDSLIASHNSIPGSINIPWSEIADSAHLLGDDTSTPIITYCMGYR